jgi:hypothetical protein
VAGAAGRLRGSPVGAAKAVGPSQAPLLCDYAELHETASASGKTMSPGVVSGKRGLQENWIYIKTAI